MRIRMRLSRESEWILRQEKQRYKEKEDISVTYGWIVNHITKNIVAQHVQHIDWLAIKACPYSAIQEHTPSDTAADIDFNTTLNLENTVLEYIQQLQILFKEVFSAARIHKAFVVRMILKADWMLKQGYNIYQEEK